MWIECLIATTMWGVAPLFERVYTRDVSLCTIVLVFSAFLLALLPIYLFFTRQVWMKEARMLFTSKRHVVSHGILALIVSLIAWGAYLLAMQRSNGRTHLVVTLTCTYPLLTAFLLYFLYNAKVGTQEWLGILLVVAGISLLVSYSPKIDSPVSA